MGAGAPAPAVAAPTVTPDVETFTGDGDFSGWFCVATDPWPCPADGCGFVASYLTAAHLVVVWPANADPSLLANAANAGELGRNPRVVEYEPGFGRCVAWDEWVRLGRPIHGRVERPDGWEDRPSRI